MFKIRWLCASIALSTAPFAGAEELSETGEFIDGVAAIVNEGVVLKSQLSDELALIIKRAAEGNFQLPPEGILEEQVLERLEAMTTAELLELESNFDEQLAGGDALAVIGTVFLVLLILELVGVTDIFKSV